jgi:hypothetical protein
MQVAGEAYRLTARHVLDIMFNKFNLMAHLAALRKYLLLGQVTDGVPIRYYEKLCTEFLSITWSWYRHRYLSLKKDMYEPDRGCGRIKHFSSIRIH